MFNRLIVLAGFAALTAPAFAQELATVDPNVSLAQVGGVVSQCEIVAADPEIANSSSGICITATRNFLATVAIGEDEPVQVLVVRLLELSQLFPECDEFDDEIGAAIRAAAARLDDDSEARADYIVAAETIEACEISNLAAISASAVTPG